MLHALEITGGVFGAVGGEVDQYLGGPTRLGGDAPLHGTRVIGAAEADTVADDLAVDGGRPPAGENITAAAMLLGYLLDGGTPLGKVVDIDKALDVGGGHPHLGMAVELHCYYPLRLVGTTLPSAAGTDQLNYVIEDKPHLCEFIGSGEARGTCRDDAPA